MRKAVATKEYLIIHLRMCRQRAGMSMQEINQLTKKDWRRTIAELREIWKEETLTGVQI